MKIKTGFLFALLLASSNIWADDLFVQLDSPTLTAGPGDTLTFSGFIVNNDNFVIDLNSIDITLNGMFTTDNTVFFLGPLTIDASPGTQTIDFQFFSVTVNDPYTDLDGIQTGTVTILGNVETTGAPDISILNPLGSATFSIDVNTTPEPSSFALMLASLAGVTAGAMLISWRRRTQRGQ
jgi:hypothetical protein